MTAFSGAKAQILITSTPNVAMADEVLLDSGDHTTFTVTVPNVGHRYWDDSATFVIQSEVDDIQTVTITGTPTGGTFTLVFGAQTTATINWNDNAATVQTRLQNLSSIGAGNCTVTGGPGPGTPFVVEFKSALAYAAQGNITLGTNSLTGGTSPNVSIVHTQTGSTWTTASATTYTLQYVGGKVIFNTALSGTPNVRVHSGAYFAYSAMADAMKAEASYDADMLDNTTFTTTTTPTVWRTYTPSLTKASFKLTKWNVDATFLTAITNGTKYVLSLLPDVTGTNRMEAYAFTKADGIKAAMDALVSEDLEFTVTGNFYIV